MTELFILVVVTILSVYAAVRLHEILHYLVARALHYQACFKHVGVLAFQVEYRNQNRPLDNFLIAFISPFLLTLIGILIPLNYYTLVLKVTCLMNLFNLLLFTADGEVILLSIVQLIQKEKNSEK